MSPRDLRVITEIGSKNKAIYSRSLASPLHLQQQKETSFVFFFLLSMSEYIHKANQRFCLPNQNEESNKTEYKITESVRISRTVLSTKHIEVLQFSKLKKVKLFQNPLDLIQLSKREKERRWLGKRGVFTSGRGRYKSVESSDGEMRITTILRETAVELVNRNKPSRLWAERGQ